MEARIDEDLMNKLTAATVRVAETLPTLAWLSNDQKRRILKRYVAALEGNFLAWMAATSITCRSMKSRYAADQNLWDEISEDHPGMLREFAKSADAEPDAADFDAVAYQVSEIRRLVSELSGLKNIPLLTTLETVSYTHLTLPTILRV